MAMYGRPAGDETDSEEELMLYCPSSTNNSEVEKTSFNLGDPPINNSMHKEEITHPEPSYPPEKLEQLRVAIMKGNLKMVKEIIENYISVDTLMKGHWTPLLYACTCSQYDIVNYLLDKGANPNFHQEMFTPLMALCASRNPDGKLVECCEKLIQHGATVNISEKHQMTPLMFAAKGGSRDVVELLIKNQADVNVQDNRGWPALSWAANQGNGEIVKLLLENKADPSLICISGKTLADLARDQGYSIIADVLQNMSSSNTDPSLLMKLPVKEKKNTSDNNNSAEDTSPQKFKRYGDLEVFLSGLGLSHLIPLFEEQKINFQMFLCLTDEELEKLGVDKLGERKTILNSLKNVHKKKWEESSLISFRNKSYVSCPEILAILENISKHILYIKSTINYLQNKIEENQYSLEIGKDIVQVSNLSQQARITIENVKTLQEELKGFILNLEKEERKVEHQPADLISEQELSEKTVLPKYFISAGLILLAVVAVKSANLLNAFRST